MSTFRRAIITAPGQIVLENIEKRTPAAGEVLIRIMSSAVCGSDMHIYAGKHPYTKIPTTIGHELSGVVEAVGRDVGTVKVGDRVCVEPLITCGTCYYCGIGRYDYCENLRLKYRSDNSAYADYYYAEEKWIHQLPDNVSFDEGALMEPLATTVHATMIANIKLCDSVCILGDGPIGLLLTQLARVCGATKIFVLGLMERNLQLAEQFGAVAMKSEEASIKEILRRTNNRGVDVVFEAVGIPFTFKQSLSVVKRGGRAVIFGIFEDDFSARPLVDAMVREIEVVGTSSYCWDFQRALELVSGGHVDLKPLITHHYKLADVKKAMDLKSSRQEQPLKIILEP